MRPRAVFVASSLVLAAAASATLLPFGFELSAEAYETAGVVPVSDSGATVQQQRAPEPEPAAPPPPPPPPTPAEALEQGTLVVVSLASQKAFVFRKGEFWDSTPVSTGKEGKETPTGAFPILQKKKEHRSTLYDDAPMPYMQRITWDGVALHAGRVPAYPASHGCIRLPAAFAEKLYGITNYTSTIVMVTDEPVGSARKARLLTIADVQADVSEGSFS